MTLADDLNAKNAQAEFRKLPSVDALLHMPAVLSLGAGLEAAEITAAVRAALEQARRTIAAGETAPLAAAWPALVESQLAGATMPSLRPAINAAGVIVHTNLGRAPLSEAALAAVQQVAAGYSTLEYDLDAGQRGSRHDHARKLLCELTGAEDALVVNNNAAAVFLALAGLCAGREVLISRSQLLEIGGGFRIPDVLRQSGAQLVEVGTTNRTHLRDFAQAVTPQTAALMRVHSSNFRQIGFVAMPGLDELAATARAHNILLIDDLGSGTLIDPAAYGLAHEPTVPESVQAGADVVTFSGDKLLGGPQAGLIVGKREHIERLRRHPLARAVRVDKMTLAALEATLHAYRRGRAVQDVPVWQMIAADLEALRSRADAWRHVLVTCGVAAELWPGESAVGGGSLPGETLPTWLLAAPAAHLEETAARLRQSAIPIVCRIQKDRLVFDPRTVLPRQDAELAGALQAILPGAQ